VFRHLAESGRLLDEEGRFRADIEIDELEVPANVRLVTGRRLERLSEATQQTLSVAAVAGRHLGFELLEAVADVAGDDLIDALDEAERASLVVTRTSAEQEEYWFAHELVRQTFLARLPAARRRRHHLALAEAIERLHGDDLAAQAGTSVDRTKLFHYLVLAGKRALESAAVEDALRHLRRAAALAEQASESEQAEMFFQLGLAERSAGNWGEAVAPWRRAIEIYQKLGDVEVVGRTCLAAAYSLAWAARFVEAYELAQQGLVALEGRPSGERAQLLALSGAVVALGGHYQPGMQQLAEALALAEEREDLGAMGYVLFWTGVIHVVYLEMEDARRVCERGAEVLRAAGELWHLAGTLGFLCESLVNLGRFDDARRVHGEVLPLAERLGNAGALWHCVMMEGEVDFCETGDLDALEAQAHKEIELCEQAGMAWGSWGWSWLAVVEFLRGNWDLAIERAEKAVTTAAPTTMWGLEWALHFEYLAYAGRRDESLALLEARKDQLPRLAEPAGWGPWLMLLSAVEGLFVLGEKEQAAGLYPVVLHCMERTGVVNAYPDDAKLLERIAGIAATAGAQWEAAESHFATALEQAETMPHRPEQAHTRRFYATMLLERDGPGDRERALQLVAEAEGLYRSMHMPGHVAMVRELR
jgi:tetratricopeptide (TPR) repeat protein